MKELNPENKCHQLYKLIKPKKDSLHEIFEIQKRFQKKLKCFSKTMLFHNRMEQIDKQWRNLCVEFGEFMSRLPYKEWKRYSIDKLRGKFETEEWLEILYEYIDMAHFFFNIGIYLGIDAKMFYSLYMSKNRENFNRQKRGY